MIKARIHSGGAGIVHMYAIIDRCITSVYDNLIGNWPVSDRTMDSVLKYVFNI